MNKIVNHYLQKTVALQIIELICDEGPQRFSDITQKLQKHPVIVTRELKQMCSEKEPLMYKVENMYIVDTLHSDFDNILTIIDFINLMKEN